MSAFDEASLRWRFRRWVLLVAATSGCGASVTVSPSDAGVEDTMRPDAPVMADLPRTIDAPPLVDLGVDAWALVDMGVDAPTAADVAAPTDLGPCEAVHTSLGGGTFCPSESVRFPCGFPPDLQGEASEMVPPSVCEAHCRLPGTPAGPPYCYRAVATGEATLTCQTPCPGGRRPEGFRDDASGRDTGVGAWFARLAALECASVAAFARMVDELVAHGAPDALVLAARAAVDDERRHTVLAAGLSRAFGREPPLPVVDAAAVRPLDAVARDNAVEGCVRETFGALVATWQAEHARDPRVAAAMGVIARDETRHAALSWSLHAWALERLDADARAGLAVAQRAALASLRRELGGAVDGALVSVAGMPDTAQQQALLDALAGSIEALA